MKKDEIGLVIWGCKGGFKVFCSNEAVDYQIVDTIRNTNNKKDIRLFIRFNQNKLDVYSLEFTSEYKIYTQYRSCYDGGTGGFVAISICIPHQLCIDNIREVLHQMMNKYFAEYIHPLDCTFYPDKYDDIRPFDLLLHSVGHVIKESRKLRTCRSDQNNAPKIRLYKDILEIDEFFICPYRKEFYVCQEVIFIAFDLYDRIPETFKNVSDPPLQLIQTISEPESLPELCLKDITNVIIKSLIINEVECSASNSIQVNDFDDVTLELTRPYCNNVIVRGSVKELIEQKILYEKDSVLLLNFNRVEFTYSLYSFDVYLDGELVPDNVLMVSFDAKNWKSIVSSKLEDVSGRNLQQMYWAIIPCLNKKHVQSKKALKLTDFLGPENRIELHSDVFNYSVSVGNVKVAKLAITLSDNVQLDFSIEKDSQSEIQFILPKEEFDENKFQFQTDGDAIINRQNNKIDILPESFKYILRVPKYDLSITEWDFLINDKSRRQQDNKIRLNPDENVKDGVLKIGDFRFEFIVTDNNEIVPVGYIVISSSSVLIDVFYRDKTYNICNNPIIFPSRPEITDKENKFFISEERQDPILLIDVQLISSDQQSDQQSKQKLVVKFINCKGFNLKYRGKEHQETETINKAFDQWTIENANKIEICKKSHTCIILKNYLAYNDQRLNQVNEKNGFKVLYNDDGTECYVEYVSRTDAFARLRKYKIPLLLLTLVVILIGGIAVCFPRMKEPTPAISIKFSVKSRSSDDIKLDASYKISSAQEELIKIDTNKNIVVLWNEDFFDKQCDKKWNEYIRRICDVKIKLDWTLADYSTREYSEETVLRNLKSSENIEKKLKEFAKKTTLQTMEFDYVPSVVNAVKGFKKKIERESGDSVMYCAAKATLENYPITLDFLAKYCWENVDTTNLESLKTYLTSLGETDLAESHKEKAKQMCDGIIEKEKKAKEYAQKVDIAQKAVAVQIARLHREDCTKQTVKEVENWWNDYSDKDLCGVDLSVHIKVYKHFFTATSIDEMKALKNFRSRLSDYQYNSIIRGYCKNSESFNILSHQQRTFKAPYEIGVIKNDK